ncbi:hypothetical protein NEDG_00564 [Nematocida displodere]|uniref:Plus3 domain-containing protein n=1 Tax=Nematocida displodere TaxID=1805483 RepID=A0A177ED25_9MICR|nr:hypothetical protein NEDG_00564 [Nematocida displodere]
MARKHSGKSYNDEEDLYLGAEDKKQLESLPEIERERILYERYSDRLRKAERKELEQRAGKFGEESESDSFSRERESRDKAIPRITTAKSSYDVFKNIVLKRDTLLKIVYKRMIDKLVGYYIKIRLPSGYSIYKILSIYEGKTYEVGGGVTNRWMSVGRKKDRKEVNIQSISNLLVTEEEYNEYTRDNTVVGDKDTIKLWKKLSREIEEDPTEEELNYILSQRRRFLRYGKVTTRRRLELKALLSKAREENDLGQVKEIEKELKEIGEWEGSACK